MAAARLTLQSTVLGTPDPRGLAEFYRRPLGWQVHTDEPEWVTIAPPGGRPPGLSFQPQDDVRVYLDPAGHPFCLFT